MYLSRSAFRIVGSVLLLFWSASGCGARTGLHEAERHRGGGAGGALEDGAVSDVASGCSSDEECPATDLCAPRSCERGACVDGPPVRCDDGDTCTSDECEPATGECRFRPLSFDQDQDGYNGPRPGFRPGQPGSCGDDCDDTSAAAHPGGVEICDGVDNDCNGVIDDDARFVPEGRDAVRVSSDLFQASRGGMAYNGAFYASSYGGRETFASDQVNFFKGLQPDGRTYPGLDEQPVTVVSGDSYTGPIVWTGAVFGMAWEDRRDGDWEIYFNRLDPDANKLGPDRRITISQGFSLGASMLWNGAEFVVAWQDDRQSPGSYRIFAQRIGIDGALVGDNTGITPAGMNTESVGVAEGETTIGYAFSMNDGIAQQIGFRTTAPDLGGRGDLVLVTTNGGRAPSIVWNRDRYYVAWERKTPAGAPGKSIWAAALAEDGAIILPERPIATSPTFARGHSLVALGDRLLVVWSDDRNGNFELYSKMLTPDLVELTADARVTTAPEDSVGPLAVFGPEGDVGVLFEDKRDGMFEVFFTRLVCQAGP